MNLIFNKELTKKNFDKAFNFIFENYNKTKTIDILESLKMMGAVFSTKGGLSLSLSDLKYLKKQKKIKPFLNKISKLKENEVQFYQFNNQKINNIWNETNNYLKSYILMYVKNNDYYNQLLLVLESGARGSKEQIHQLIGMRSLMVDQTGAIVPYPIKNSFLDGLNVFEYLLSSFGARKGIIDTALKTADSGYLTRRLIEACYDLIIVSEDCRNLNFLVNFVKKLNTPSRFKIKTTTLSCNFTPNLCQRCFGMNLSTRLVVSLGETIGILSAHSISEPSTQLTMRTFHTGGVFTGKSKINKIQKFSGFKLFEKDKAKMKLINWENKIHLSKFIPTDDKFVGNLNLQSLKTNARVLPLFVGFLNKQKDILKLTRKKHNFWLEKYKMEIILINEETLYKKYPYKYIFIFKVLKFLLLIKRYIYFNYVL